MNFAGNNIAISIAESWALRVRLYAIGLRLDIISICLLQTMVGDGISS